MKTKLLPNLFISRSPWLAALVCGLTFLLASVSRVQAASYTIVGGTNQYNVYTYDPVNLIGGTGGGSSTDPAAQGTPLPGFAFMPYGSPALGNGNGNYSYSLSPSSASYFVNFSGALDPTGSGSTISVNYSGAGQAELRLDWTATYMSSGGPLPTSFFIIASGSVGIYDAVAGQETFYWNGQTSTATIQNNGFNAGTYGLGGGPWWGTTTSGFFITSISSATFTPTLASLSANDTFLVQGYLDMVVDPGTFQIQIVPVQPPLLGIGTYSNLPVVFYPTAAGTNFVVQMSTNLTSTNWVVVTNGVPFTALQITNPPNPAFFRLH